MNYLHPSIYGMKPTKPPLFKGVIVIQYMFNRGIDRRPAYSFIRESKEWATRTVTFGAVGHAYQPPRKIFMPNGQKPFDMSFDSGDGGVNGRIFRETYGPVLADRQRGIPPHLVFSFYPTIREWIKEELSKSSSSCQCNWLFASFF
jgi:hypothetical protein